MSALKSDKGVEGGSCNRTACQAPGATWWNPHTYAYYCGTCAALLNREMRLHGIAPCVNKAPDAAASSPLVCRGFAR